MRRALLLSCCFLDAMAHPDPSAKPLARLVLPRTLGDCRSCSVTASPTVLKGASAWVSLEIVGVNYGQASDWVGVIERGDLTPDGALLRYPMRYQSAARSCWPRTMAPPGMASLTCAGQACCTWNNYTTTGQATLGFELINMRTDMMFILVQGSMQFPQVIATSGTVRFESPAEPTQVHLALSAGPGEMRVSWTSANLSQMRAAAAPAVRWGRQPGTFDEGRALATGATYTRDMLCERGGPARTLGWRDPGTTWSAVLTQLTPGVRYYYTVGSDAPGAGWSHERADGDGANLSFVLPPSDVSSVRLLAFGDMGKAPSAWDGSLEHSWDNHGQGELGSWNTTRLLQVEAAAPAAARRRLGAVSFPPTATTAAHHHHHHYQHQHGGHDDPPTRAADAVLHIGDIAYAVGFGSEWDEFLMQIEPVASRLPWMTTDGNHERNCPCMAVPPSAAAAGLTWLNGSDSGGECGVPYGTRFTMPQASTDAPWYALRVGPVAIVLMSTEHDFSQTSTQLADLHHLLQGVDRTQTPWLIFGGHRPMYVDQYGPYIEPASAPLRALIEPLLLKHRVDLALWGHHHSYQRSCPLAAGKCVESGQSSGQWGVVHAVIGAAGYEFSRVADRASAPAWVRFVNDTLYGYATLDANASHLHFAFVRADGQGVLDEVVLDK